MSSALSPIQACAQRAVGPFLVFAEVDGFEELGIRAGTDEIVRVVRDDPALVRLREGSSDALPRGVERSVHVDERSGMCGLELRAGPTLTELMQTPGQLPLEIALEIALDVAEAFEFLYPRRAPNCSAETFRVDVVGRPGAFVQHAGSHPRFGDNPWLPPERVYPFHFRQRHEGREATWVFGIVAHDLLAGAYSLVPERPFAGDLRGTLPGEVEVKPLVHDLVKGLLRRCLVINPAERPLFDEVRPRIPLSGRSGTDEDLAELVMNLIPKWRGARDQIQDLRVML